MAIAVTGATYVQYPVNDKSIDANIAATYGRSGSDVDFVSLETISGKINA